jgi:hypothetical protein
MQQAPGLRSDRRDQRRVVVPERGDGNPRQGVEIDLAVGIGHPAAIAMAEGDRQAGIGIHQVRHGPPIAEALKLKRRLAPPDNDTRTRTRSVRPDSLQKLWRGG